MRGLPVVGTRRFDGASAVSPYPRPRAPVIIFIVMEYFFLRDIKMKLRLEGC